MADVRDVSPKPLPPDATQGGTRCAKVRVEGNPAQWFACTRENRHSGRCKKVPVKLARRPEEK